MIGRKAMATETVSLEMSFEFFDSFFRVTTMNMDSVVNLLGIPGQICNQESYVGYLGYTFGFGN